MKANLLSFAAAAALIGGMAIAGCKKDTAEPASASGAPATTSGDGTAAGDSGGGSGASIPALVSVNLENVLNNLSVELNVNRNNIPVIAQVPIDVAASVCGVSVSALAASVASGTASCTATTTSAALNQAVQQQIASGGDVQGGDQVINSN